MSRRNFAVFSLNFLPVFYRDIPGFLSEIPVFMNKNRDFFGIFGGWFSCVTTLDLNTYQFIKGVRAWFNPWDPFFGLIKAFFFGFSITSIACFFGFYSKNGAEGVGKATTSTVVISCISILVLDYILAEILL